MKKPFHTWEGDTLVLNILGTPNAKRDAIGKVKGHQLCVSVTAAPHAGRATDHMVRFLADEFGVAVGDIQVVFGRMCQQAAADQGAQTPAAGHRTAEITGLIGIRSGCFFTRTAVPMRKFSQTTESEGEAFRTV
jgi:uncharacterized protein YggU (UPF0235/DUF167 family)